mgnify:CR=1
MPFKLSSEVTLVGVIENGLDLSRFKPDHVGGDPVNKVFVVFGEEQVGFEDENGFLNLFARHDIDVVDWLVPEQQVGRVNEGTT